MLKSAAKFLAGLLLLITFVALALYLALRINAADAPALSMASPVQLPRPANAEAQSQILFGDLHVHTNFSVDAAVQSLPGNGTEGARDVTDACDYARFCSALDFWSLNDHAEGLDAKKWLASQQAVEACNAVSEQQAPDTIAFLGWEWSQRGSERANHYGHKNVVLRSAEQIPARPIGSGSGFTKIFAGMGVVNSVLDIKNWNEYGAYHKAMLDSETAPACEEGVAVRDLPNDCMETASTPEQLFAKLDDWGMDALVIPHGLAWGVTNPMDGDLAVQLSEQNHNPEWQRLLEVYSGHGNSERYRDIDRGEVLADGQVRCPAPSNGFEACCWRAAGVIRARCEQPESEQCQAEVNAAQVGLLTQSLAGVFGPMVEGIAQHDLGSCDQLDGDFLPAYNYIPMQSAQYAAAIEGDDGSQYRWGFIGSSDNHRARPGTGYKEFGRLHNTDGNEYFPDLPASMGDSFYYTGGLVAVHAAARDRNSVYDALHARQVYATSGPRIQLWFSAEDDAGSTFPMGSSVKSTRPLTFQVKALGAREQKPGCPAAINNALSADRLDWLCKGECYNPSDTRVPIERLEVVRIKRGAAGDFSPQQIQDPWKVIECSADGNGCEARFSVEQARTEVSYYVRAIQVPTPTINGDPLNCERDADGRCVKSSFCPGGPDVSLAAAAPNGDCMAPAAHRAWSSPIYLLP